MARRGMLLRTLLAAAIALGSAGRPADAAITSVELSLHSVQAFRGSNALLVRFEGRILGDTLVQIDYPLHLVVFEQAGGRYVRFDVSSGAVTGLAPQLLDGATSAESLALLAEGDPLPGVKLAYVGAGRVDVLLPPDALSGALAAYAFAVYEGEALVSNALPLEGEP